MIRERRYYLPQPNGSCVRAGCASKDTGGLAGGDRLDQLDVNCEELNASGIRWNSIRARKRLAAKDF